MDDGAEIIGMGVAALLIFIFYGACTLAGIWLGVSVVTSGVKAGTENCGTTYKIERYIQGDWFCPEEKKDGL